jgi:hypothetical protein
MQYNYGNIETYTAQVRLTSVLRCVQEGALLLQPYQSIEVKHHQQKKSHLVQKPRTARFVNY